MTTFAALGDSITVGVGDPVTGPHGRSWRGWAALLAESLPDPHLHILATDGARAAEVAGQQLPRALALAPDLASVVFGVNDTLRPGFDPEKIFAAADQSVGALRAAGAQVLTMRLPDPGQMFGLPDALARPLARRAGQINAVFDVVAERHGTLHFDAARDPQTYLRPMWAVDRLHPSERGHRHIARSFCARLASAGFGVGPPPGAEPVNPPPGRLDEIGWLATKGVAWLALRGTALAPFLLAMAAREVLAGTMIPVASQAQSLTIYGDHGADAGAGCQGRGDGPGSWPDGVATPVS